MSMTTSDSSQRLAVSIVVVTRNNAAGLDRTLASIAMQAWQAREVIVIDGQSTDHTSDVLARHLAVVTRATREPDEGIYDAMNKGLRHASFPWVIFMNAGDCFDSPASLETAMNIAGDDVDVVYSDAHFGQSKQLAVCSHESMRIIHQAMVYRRSLHEKHGQYLHMKQVTISDYLFFMAIREKRWKKSPVVIAHCEGGGVSTRPRSYEQKMAVDLLADARGSMLTGLMLIAYPVYRVLLRPMVRMLRPGRI